MRSLKVCGAMAVVAGGVFGTTCAAQCGTQLISQFAQPIEKIASIDASRVIVARGQRLEIFNVATVSNPVFAGGVTLPEPIRKLECNATRAWVVTESSTGAATLRVFSITTNTPVQTAASPVGSDCDPSGDVAYAVDLASGQFTIADYSFGEFPLLIGTWSTTSWQAYDRVRVSVVGSRAFIALRDDDTEISTLQVLSIADPGAPVLVGQTSDVGLPDFGAIAATGNIVYVCRGERLDVLNLNSLPTIQRSSTFADDAQWVGISGTTLYVGASYEGMKAYNITNNVISPPLLGTFNSPGNCSWASFGASRVYAADGGGGFEIVNNTNPAAMTQLGWMDDALEGVKDIQTLENGFTYATDRVGLRVLNLTNPAAPALLRTIPIAQLADPLAAGCEARVLRVGIGYLLLAGCDGGFWVYSLANANNPALLSYTSGLGIDYDLRQVGSFVYAGGSDGMKILNIVDPAHPTLAGTYTPVGVTSEIEAANGLLYVGTRDFGLWILDDISPAAPQLVGYLGISPGNLRGLRVDATTAYTMDTWDRELHCINIANSSAPFEVSAIASDPNVGDCIDRRNNTLLAVVSREFTLYDVSVPGEFVRQGEYAVDPSRGFVNVAELNGTCVAVTEQLYGRIRTNQTQGHREYGLKLFSLPTQWKPDEVEHAPAVVTCQDGFAEFQTRWRGNAGAITYQWMRNGLPVSNSDRVLGADTERLVISGVLLADMGEYVCVATNSCGARSGQAAQLSVCVGDFDCSGGVDGDDVIQFFSAWDAGLEGADVNRDGSVDGDDVIVFFAGWDAGC